MPTPWKYANTVYQHAEVDSHVEWNGEETNYHQIKSTNQVYLTTKKDLLFIANPTTNNLRMKTNYLFLCEFRFENIPTVISGIEVEIQMYRGGRITDDTIQLIHDGIFIGENRASNELSLKSIYGSASDTWDAVLSKVIVESPSFGIGIRYQSHPEMPHKESPKVDYVRMRVF